MQDRKPKKLSNFYSYRIKILLGFSTVLFLVFVLGVYGYLVIQRSKDSVEEIADKETPVLIAEKGLALAGENSMTAVRDYISSDGDEYYREQFQKEAAITAYNMATLKKLGASAELNALVEKNTGWLEFVETEVLDMYENGDRALVLQNLEKGHTNISKIETGYQELITSKEGSIKELEQEVLAAGKISKIVIYTMSLLIALMCIGAAIILLRKILILKSSKTLSRAA